jgi:hypothetical protein
MGIILDFDILPMSDFRYRSAVYLVGASFERMFSVLT